MLKIIFATSKNLSGCRYEHHNPARVIVSIGASSYQLLKIMKASNYFHGTDGYNCAQAILKAFQQKYSIPDDTIAEYAKFGGGRAEQGVCGALFALHHIVNTPEHITSANAHFEKEAGSIKCREIKKLNKLSCKECVDLSANILNLLIQTY